MSNGHVCCILGVCCPPPRQVEALARKMAAASGGDYTVAAMLPVAEKLLEDFALVPKAVGEAIERSYRPVFREAFAEEG